MRTIWTLTISYTGIPDMYICDVEYIWCFGVTHVVFWWICVHIAQHVSGIQTLIFDKRFP